MSNIESDLTDRTKDIVNYLIDITELNLMDKYKNNLDFLFDFTRNISPIRNNIENKKEICKSIVKI